jgi:hypothetical protein
MKISGKVQKDSNAKPPTPQTQRDHIELLNRKKGCELSLLDMIIKIQPYPKKFLCDGANILCRTTRCAKPDRLCHRNREALACYFCEHVANFPEGFPFSEVAGDEAGSEVTTDAETGTLIATTTAAPDVSGVPEPDDVLGFDFGNPDFCQIDFDSFFDE